MNQRQASSQDGPPETGSLEEHIRRLEERVERLSELQRLDGEAFVKLADIVRQMGNRLHLLIQEVEHAGIR